MATVLFDGKVLVKGDRVQTVDEKEFIEAPAKMGASVLEKRKVHVPKD